MEVSKLFDKLSPEWKRVVLGLIDRGDYGLALLTVLVASSPLGREFLREGLEKTYNALVGKLEREKAFSQLPLEVKMSFKVCYNCKFQSRCARMPSDRACPSFTWRWE